MALTKVNRGGLNTGIADSSNATFLTATSAEGVTLAGTLAVTGVHTVGTNAVATSDGGAVTTSIIQGLAKSWVNFNGSGTVAIRDSHNIGSITDVTTGQYAPNFTNDMASVNYTVTLVVGDNHYTTTLHNGLVATGSYRMHNLNITGSYADSTIVMTNVHGDLA